MPRVLLVSYHFPPSGAIGVPRALAYIRYLRLYGCRVSVLTATMPQTPAYDPELCKSIPSDVRVHRAWNPELPFALRDQIWKRLASRHGNTMKLRDSTSKSAPAANKPLRVTAIIRSFAQ